MEEYIGLDVSMKETSRSAEQVNGSGAVSAHLIPES